MCIAGYCINVSFNYCRVEVLFLYAPYRCAINVNSIDRTVTKCSQQDVGPENYSSELSSGGIIIISYVNDQS